MQFNSKKMINLQKQLKLKPKTFTLSVLALCFLFLSSTLLAHSYADRGEYFLRRPWLAPANYLRINSQPFIPAFSTSSSLDIPGIPELFGNSAWHFPTNATNDFVNDPLVNSVNLAYQYEDQDMDTLLRLRFQEVVAEIETAAALEIEIETTAEAVNLENTIILPPLSDNRDELIPQLREEAERYNNDVASGVMNPHERTILLALNINQSHWVGIVIRLNSESGVISITYTDPAGFYGVPLHVRLLFQEVYGEDVNIENIYGLIQGDNTGCGPLVIENLIREAGGVRGDYYASNELMRRIRAHHIDLVERPRPDLGFKKRQQANVRSFNDAYGDPVGPLLLLGPEDGAKCLRLGLTPVICGGGKNDGNEQSTSANWYNLPDELRLKIFESLNARELSKAALVSKEWRLIADDYVLWRSKLQENFKGGEKIDEALDMYKEIGYPFLTVEGREVPNYKLVYRICRLLCSSGKTATKNKLRRERGELIEVNNGTFNFTIQKIIEDITAQDSKIKSLVINDIALDAYQVQCLADALKNKNCKITELNLWENRIGFAGARDLALALKDPNCKVAELDFAGNRIGDAGAEAIAAALKNENCKVTKLLLADNQIGDAGAEALADALKHENCKVTKLNLRSNRIGDAGAIVLADALKHENCKVTKLNLRSNRIGDAGAIALADALVDPNCKVTELNLAGNQIGDAGTQALAGALKDKNCKVTELNLDWNQIGHAGAQAFAGALKDKNCKVTELNLDWNQIGNDGAAAFAEALKDPNCKVTELDFAGNRIGDAGAQALADALKNENCKITELELGHNRIGDAGARDLAFALKDPNCKITELELGYNQIDAAGAGALADALKDPNCKITELELGHNRIGFAGARDLALALINENCNVTTLRLNLNEIGDAGAEALADALKDKNCKITELELGRNQIDAAGTKALVNAVLHTRKGGRKIKITGIKNFETFLKHAEIDVGAQVGNVIT